MIPALLVWLIPRRWWAAMERPVMGYQLTALLRCIPAFTLGSWMIFGVFFPIDSALGGNRPGQPTSAAEIVAVIVCWTPGITTLVGGWPIWLLPPGARNKEETSFFTAHWGTVFGLMALAFGVYSALHSWWPMVWAMLLAAVLLAVIQIGLVRPRNRPDQ